MPVQMRGMWPGIDPQSLLGVLTQTLEVTRYVVTAPAGRFRRAHPCGQPPTAGWLDQERGSRNSKPEKCPYPFYPEPGGLLPWAGTDNGDRVCWLTEGQPDGWTVVC